VLKMKIARPTIVIIITIAPPNGSRSHPSRNGTSPKVSHVKFSTNRRPGSPTVAAKAAAVPASAATCPAMASAAARRRPPTTRIASATASGAAGISQG
jgi:hypothetical protein